MKSVLFILLAVALLVSCSSEPPICECMQSVADSMKKDRESGYTLKEKFKPSDECSKLLEAVTESDHETLEKCESNKSLVEENLKRVKHLKEEMDKALKLIQ